MLRLDRQIRLWAASRRAGRCEAVPESMSTGICDRPAIACVLVLGRRRLICDDHIFPLDREDLPDQGKALAFLARFFGIELTSTRGMFR